MKTLAPHDLVHFATMAQLTEDGARRPGWVHEGLPSWAVVRQACAKNGLIAVSVRGGQRNQRWAALLAERTIEHSVTPQEIAHLDACARVPALAALARVASIADTAWPDLWGPAGSVGFEIATGEQVTTEDSNLDLVVTAPTALDPWKALQTQRALLQAAGSVHVDISVQTPCGGFRLDEWLRVPALEPVTVRTPRGPVLMHDPWHCA